MKFLLKDGTSEILDFIAAPGSVHWPHSPSFSGLMKQETQLVATASL
jgi:hypothetical protein